MASKDVSHYILRSWYGCPQSNGKGSEISKDLVNPEIERKISRITLNDVLHQCFEAKRETEVHLNSNSTWYSDKYIYLQQTYFTLSLQNVHLVSMTPNHWENHSRECYFISLTELTSYMTGLSLVLISDRLEHCDRFFALVISVSVPLKPTSLYSAVQFPETSTCRTNQHYSFGKMIFGLNPQSPTFLREVQQDAS